jgi:radical SAM protein with 4Fe4S-binding SPASM domain
MKGATVSIITNGNSGTTILFSELIRLKVDLFELPLHSANAETHDRMTGVIGSWEKLKSTIRSITRMGGYVVPVIVITKYNFNQIGETLRYLNGLGLNRIMINRYNIGGDGIANKKLVLPSMKELNEAFKQANQLAGELKLKISSNVCTPHCVVDPRSYQRIVFSSCSQEISKRPLTLTSSGDLRFCNHSPHVLGNIHSTNIGEIIKEVPDEYRVDKRPDYCRDCDKYEDCKGGCRAAAEQVGKSFCDVDPLVELTNDKYKVKSA